MKPVYLDYNATTPVAPEVKEAMLPYFEERFGNPSSGHAYGREAHAAVEEGRRRTAELLGCDPSEVIFTSGGSESNNLAILGAARLLRDRGRGDHLVCSAVEHPAVLRVAERLEREGFRVDRVPVDRFGRVDPASVEAALTDRTVLVSVMLANNEVGTLQPVAGIAARLKARGILFHTDAAQAVGKIPVRVDALGVDLLSLAGHKFHAPKGIGALYVRKGVELEPIIHGAGHERGVRAGTENVPYIAGFGTACTLAARGIEARAATLRDLRDRLHRAIEERIPGLRLNGHPHERLPNTLSLSFPGIRADELLAAVPEVAASPGAACHSGKAVVSHVLSAMGVPETEALGTVRFSVGEGTTEAEIHRAVDAILSGVERLRKK